MIPKLSIYLFLPSFFQNERDLGWLTERTIIKQRTKLEANPSSKYTGISCLLHIVHAIFVPAVGMEFSRQTEFPRRAEREKRFLSLIGATRYLFPRVIHNTHTYMCCFLTLTTCNNKRRRSLIGTSWAEKVQEACNELFILISESRNNNFSLRA